MKTLPVFFLLLLTILPVDGNEELDPQGPAMDVVFCVDLSGSSNGILDDIRDRYWEVINQVSNYRPTPTHRIAVVGFSRPSFGARNHYVKVLKGFTSDFDLLSYELFKLQPYIEKGDQMVGSAIRTCVRELDWSEDSQSIKVIYLIGNGRVDLGPISYLDACDMAVKEGITINTLYCKTTRNMPEEESGWRNIARVSGGNYNQIFIHKRPPILVTTYDSTELYKLSNSLSKTYMGYGKKGEERIKVMAKADENAYFANLMTFESRMYYKISERYQFQNSQWDLVDYLRWNDKLPGNYHGFSSESLSNSNGDQAMDHVKKLREVRRDLLGLLRKHIPLDRQEQINRMLDERGLRRSENFERVVINSLDNLAASKGMSITPGGKYEFSR
jgi:hypothetical protein